MRIAKTSLIPENTPPENVKSIAVYDGNKRMGTIDISQMRPQNLGEKLYSFGALSDVHTSIAALQAREKFQKALAYLNNVEKVRFICIAGDLTGEGTDAQLQSYGQYVRAYSPDTPVWEVTGNHDLQSRTSEAPFDFLRPYTGHDLYYSFEEGNDLFIMFGMSGWYSYTKSSTFSDGSLNWLYQVLEANRNKRCFLFAHPPRFDGSGKPYDPVPTGDLLTGKPGTVFKALMEHYRNVIWFHGHTHMSFECQNDVPFANYDRMYGCHSVHIPSLASVRVLNSSADGYDGIAAVGGGYVVDVYENQIRLRGRDFVGEADSPLATYCLDTTPQTIPAGTFRDSTGTIITEEKNDP